MHPANDFDQNLIQDAPLFFVAISAEGKTLMMNKTLLGALGYTLEEVIGKDYLSHFVPETDRGTLALVFNQLVQSRAPTLNENRVLTKDGRQRLVEWHGRQVFRPDGGLDYFYGLGIDITERRRAEEALQKSELHFRAILDNVLDGMIIINENCTVETFNPAAERIFNYASEEVLGQNLKMLMPEPYRSHHDRYVADYLRTGQSKIMGLGRELSGRRKNGEIFPLNIAVSEMWVGGQRKFIGILRDITRRKKAEDDLRESERRLTTLMGNLPGMVYRCRNDKYRTMKFVSEGCRQLTGYQPEDMIADKKLFHNRVIHPGDREDVWDQVQQALQDRMRFTLRYRIRTAVGEEKWVREQGIGVFSDAGDLLAIEGFIIDISDRIRAEEELRKLNEELEKRVAERTAKLEESLATLKTAQDYLVQSEKMAALGELMAGVAHEINTPVGIGVTAASYLELKTREFTERLASGNSTSTDLEQYLQKISAASTSILTNLNRAADLVKSFKQVAVDQASEERRRFKLKDYIDKVLVSLRPKYKRTPHTIAVHCPEDLEIFSYPGVYSQIITNLVMNSLIHGLEGTDAGQIVLDLSLRADKLFFEYRDNGRGISAEHVKKIYDPFFTTKRAQGGSGLGLHIVYNLVTRILQGQIECSSIPGKGTLFQIVIPLHEELEAGD
ncbi:MAG: PAS domain S-box protein [Desulfobacterales bacterium]|nr:MAG: PAS domain S-box protein [Desulfobacterales bacterium]